MKTRVRLFYLLKQISEQMVDADVRAVLNSLADRIDLQEFVDIDIDACVSGGVAWILQERVGLRTR